MINAKEANEQTKKRIRELGQSQMAYLYAKISTAAIDGKYDVDVTSEYKRGLEALKQEGYSVIGFDGNPIPIDPDWYRISWAHLSF